MSELTHLLRTGKAHAAKFRETEKTYTAIRKHKVGTGDYRMLCMVSRLHGHHSLMHVGSTAWPRCSTSHSIFDQFYPSSIHQISTNIDSSAPRLLPAGGGPPQAHGKGIAKRVPQELELLRAGVESGDVRLDGHVPQA